MSPSQSAAPSVRAEILAAITEVDTQLGVQRTIWLNDKDASKVRGARNQIDTLLDRRHALMLRRGPLRARLKAAKPSTELP